MKAHLQWYHKVDVALDTYPYNGTTTTYEALFMGVTVITLEGATHAGRVGKSIMTRMGLSQFVAGSEERYLALGRYLAENPEILSPLRGALRDQVIAVNDGAKFTRKLESLFQDMWRHYYSSSKAS